MSIMELAEYLEIVRIIRSFSGLSKNCFQILVVNYPNFSEDTLYSILSSEYIKRMKTNHIKSQTNITKYWNLYNERLKNGESPGIIVRMAAELDICPCLVGKSVLQKYFEETGTEPEFQLNRYLRNTCLIADGHLAHEIFLCTIYDNLYSPLTEVMKHSLGQEYEIKLQNEVVRLGLAFQSEEHLRKYGYDKTPDVKLDIPIAIDGSIINWIESKALFADKEIHREYEKSQYLSYWNRFGPGLVIYWFGYVNNIVEENDKRFIIRDHLPVNFIRLNEL